LTEIAGGPPWSVAGPGRVDGSNDGSPAYVRWSHPAARLIAARRNLGAVGRNLALRHVMTPYVAFCDDDTWWEPGSLARAADALDAHPDVAAVTARIVVEPSGADDPIVLRERRPVPPEVEAQIQLLEEPRRLSPARRHVG
jgi:GT2 family glycosyltransferase